MKIYILNIYTHIYIKLHTDNVYFNTTVLQSVLSNKYIILITTYSNILDAFKLFCVVIEIRPLMLLIGA